MNNKGLIADVDDATANKARGKVSVLLDTCPKQSCRHVETLGVKCFRRTELAPTHVLHFQQSPDPAAGTKGSYGTRVVLDSSMVIAVLYLL